MAAAEGAYPHLGKGEEEVEVDVQGVFLLSVNIIRRGEAPLARQLRSMFQRASLASPLRTYNYNSFSNSSTCSIHSLTTASDGIRQSPRGLRVTEPTFGPSGIQERLNCWEKNRQ